MRKPRAILYDDEPALLSLLTLFLEQRGYEVLAFDEAVACPVYEDGGRCDKRRPCGDLIISDLEMPLMSGVELLRRQTLQGCRLSIENKAILSGNLDPDTRETIRGLGAEAFAKPCRLGTLAAWVGECERRMDLSRPLAVRRSQRRDPVGSGAVFTSGQEADHFTAEVVNRSNSGLCVRLDRPLPVAAVLGLQSQLSLASDRLCVRWTRPEPDGTHLAGMSCC